MDQVGHYTNLRILMLRADENENNSEDKINPKVNPFKSFCTQTTLHGWQYLGDHSVPICRKLIWTVMIVTAMATGFYFINWFINGWFLEHDVSTTIETTTASLSEVHFPAVTICNMNQIRRSFLTDLNIYDDLDLSLKFAKEYIIGHNETFSTKDKARVDAVLNKPEFQVMAEAYLLGKLGGALKIRASSLNFLIENNLLTTSQLVSRLAVQWEPGLMIPYAEYQGIEHRGTITTFSGSDHGICAKIFPQTFDEADQATLMNSTILRNLKALPGVKNGLNNGMHFVLDAEVYDYVDNRSASGGFKMALHHHLDMAVIRQLGFNVAPGTETQVAITPVLHSTTDVAKRRFSPDERNCYFQNEIKLTHWIYQAVLDIDPGKRSTGGRYSMSNCLLEAVLQVIPDECGCSPSFHTLGYNISRYPICTGKGIFCVSELLDRIGVMDSVMDGDKVKKCRAACEDQHNLYQVSTLPYPSGVTFRLRTEICYLITSLVTRCGQKAKRIILDEIYPELCGLLDKLNGTNPCKETGVLDLQGIPGFRERKVFRKALVDQLYLYAKDNLAFVHVYIKDPYVTRMKRDEAFSIILFVAGAGGLMGLCTGFSFLSGVEVIYHVIFGTFDFMRKKWKLRMSKKKQQDTSLSSENKEMTEKTRY